MQKNKFFELSPAERAMLEREVKPTGPAVTRLKIPRKEERGDEAGGKP
jgi:hypothetical protein